MKSSMVIVERMQTLAREAGSRGDAIDGGPRELGRKSGVGVLLASEEIGRFVAGTPDR